MAATLFRIMMVIAFVVVMSMDMFPRRKRVRQTAPFVLAFRQFIVGKKARVELIPKRILTHAESHNCEGLPAIAKRFAPLPTGAFRHLRFAR